MSLTEVEIPYNKNKGGPLNWFLLLLNYFYFSTTRQYSCLGGKLRCTNLTRFCFPSQETFTWWIYSSTWIVLLLQSTYSSLSCSIPLTHQFPFLLPLRACAIYLLRSMILLAKCVPASRTLYLLACNLKLENASGLRLM